MHTYTRNGAGGGSRRREGTHTHTHTHIHTYIHAYTHMHALCITIHPCIVIITFFTTNSLKPTGTHEKTHRHTGSDHSAYMYVCVCVRGVCECVCVRVCACACTCACACACVGVIPWQHGSFEWQRRFVDTRTPLLFLRTSHTYIHKHSHRQIQVCTQCVSTRVRACVRACV